MKVSITNELKMVLESLVWYKHVREYRSGAPVIALRYLSFDVPVKYKVVILYRIWVVTRVFRPIIFVDNAKIMGLFC